MGSQANGWGDQAQNVKAGVADAAQAGYDATRRTAGRVGDGLSDAADALSRTGHDVYEDASATAGDAWDSASSALRSGSARVRDTFVDTRDGLGAYARENPFQSMLIAGLAGAAVIGIASLLLSQRTPTRRTWWNSRR
jgi:ElaB/YqjD/DUF883 family membrane-anchored ribosome-binding protein